nr:MAG TPA: hypothetical protein [Caudoviricetes sp.]
MRKLLCLLFRVPRRLLLPRRLRPRLVLLPLHRLRLGLLRRPPYGLCRSV